MLETTRFLECIASKLVAIAVLSTLATLPVAAQAIAAPALVSPGAANAEALILDRCPTFSWAGTSDGPHELVIYRADAEGPGVENEDPVVRRLLPPAATVWTPSISDCLEPGATYAWSVRPVGGATDMPWAEPRFFRISGAPSIAELEDAIRGLRRYSEQNDSPPPQILEPDVGPEDPARAPRLSAARQDPPASRFGPGGHEGLGSSAALAAPTLGPADLALEQQIHLGHDSDFFRFGVPFLWADSNSLALGTNALASTGGYSNTALGIRAIKSNTNGSENTAVGFMTLFNNTTGSHNTAVGTEALAWNQEGSSNAAVGDRALLLNVTGNGNVAIGASALEFNLTSSFNTAVGTLALPKNLFGHYNSAVGFGALGSNEDGSRNTAVGREALFSAETTDGTAVGDRALRNNSDGIRNTAVGARALYSNTTGSGNVALGWLAGYEVDGGSDNIMIGSGVSGLLADDKTIRIGNQGTQLRTHIAGIAGISLSNGANVVVESDGRLGVGASSQRFKEDVSEMEDVSELLSALRPVRFRYREEHSSSGDRPLQYGLIAEEVARVLPELVARGADGEPFAVRYDLLSTLLLQELRRTSRENEAINLMQARLLGAQRNEIEALEKRLARLERRRQH